MNKKINNTLWDYLTSSGAIKQFLRSKTDFSLGLKNLNGHSGLEQVNLKKINNLLDLVYRLFIYSFLGFFANIMIKFLKK